MFSRIRGVNKKSDIKERLECKCVNVPIDESKDEESKVIDVECSSHPGFCVLDDSGLCKKRESAAHCSLSPVELIGEVAAAEVAVPHGKCIDEDCRRKLCGKKFHSYKLDLNNAEDTGLFADKQCQTCGPPCSTTTCTGRSREYFISWDKKRTHILIFLILTLGLWVFIYGSITAATS